MNRALVLLVLVSAVVLSGCHHADPRCAPSASSTVELRDGAGALELALKSGALCNAQHKMIGSVDMTPDSVVLKDAGGTPRMTIKPTAPAPDKTSSGIDPHGVVRVRLYRDAVQARLLRPDGVPLGSMVRNGDSARIYDPASVPIMVAEPRDRDLVIRDAEGVVRHFVVPGGDPRAAGAFAIASLDPSEQLAVYLYWSR